MDNGPERYITEDRARVIVMEGINTYELNVGSKRHEQNTKKLDRLTWMVGVGLGILLTLQGLAEAGLLHR